MLGSCSSDDPGWTSADKGQIFLANLRLVRGEDKEDLKKLSKRKENRRRERKKIMWRKLTPWTGAGVSCMLFFPFSLTVTLLSKITRAPSNNKQSSALRGDLEDTRLTCWERFSVKKSNYNNMLACYSVKMFRIQILMDNGSWISHIKADSLYLSSSWFMSEHDLGLARSWGVSTPCIHLASVRTLYLQNVRRVVSFMQTIKLIFHANSCNLSTSKCTSNVQIFHFGLCRWIDGGYPASVAADTMALLVNPIGLGSLSDGWYGCTISCTVVQNDIHS